jgi:hypothetical protein
LKRALLVALAAVSLAFLAGAAAPAWAQNLAADDFMAAKDNAKVHVASGYVCPLREGRFERNAVGKADVMTGADFCAYSGLDGVYATITLIPLKQPYDPKTALQPKFEELVATGGKLLGEKTTELGTPPLSVYTRSYKTAKLEDLTYTVEFAAAAVKDWVVEATLEYADPRDTPEARKFLKSVFDWATAEIGTQKAK